MKISYDLVVHSLIFLASLAAIKFAVTKFVTNSKNLPWENKRRIIVNTNTFLTFAFLIGAILIWGNKIEALAFSFAAFAVAIVISTKELIICFLGSIYKGSSTKFNIGDRIEINGMRGDVIDRNLLSTKMLEIGPGNQTHQYTGRSIVLPNSLFLSHAVMNESYLEDYVLHVFTIPFPYKIDMEKVETTLLEIANNECLKYVEKASQRMRSIQAKANLDSPDMKPRVLFKVISHERIDVLVRVTVPARKKGAIEQTILKKFWKEYNS